MIEVILADRGGLAGTYQRCFETPLDCRALLSYATPAVGLGRHAQLPPGNFPKPSQAKCCFTADGGRAFKKRSIVPQPRRKNAMSWTTPTLVEICIGLEINGYLPAEF